MEAVIDNQLAIIEKSVSVFQNAGQILRTNKSRSEKAIEVGKNILAAIKEHGMTPDLDTRAMNYLANVSKASKEMKEGRSEVTQIMDELKKMYTEVENNLDTKKAGTVPSQIQAERDAYVKQKAEEERRKREEAEKVAAKAKEAIEIKANATVALNNFFHAYLLTTKQKMMDSFNACTLETIDAFEHKLRNYQPAYKQEHFNTFTFLPTAVYNTVEDLITVTQSIRTQDQFNQFDLTYQSEMGSLAQELLDKIPSKKGELTEQKRIADEAAAAKEAELKRQQEAEKLRQAEMAKANAEQKKKLEAEAERIKQLEAAKLQQMEMEAEERRLAAEREQNQREEAEAKRLEQEAEDARLKAEQEAEIKKQGEQTMVMFEQEASIATDAPAPEARQGYDITVLHPAGYVQIFQFWFENEGKNLGVDKIGNTKLDQMKSFVEKHAHKQGRPNIDSKFLKYEESFKAINRKPIKA